MQVPENLDQLFMRVRSLSESLVGSLSDADASVQAMDDASPAKWHLAHTTWFFETFVLRQAKTNYEVFDERYHYLFNSYYEAQGARLSRPMRGVLTRPSLSTICQYRDWVTGALVQEMENLSEELRKVVLLGCHHEQQHQELLLTDMLYLFSQNPLSPAMWPPGKNVRPVFGIEPMRWIAGASGVIEIGCDGEGFSFDCERPRHSTFLHPHALSNRLVTNGEWLRFIEDGAYRKADLWLSDGWSWVQKLGVEAPLHWRRLGSEGWSHQFGLDGLTAIDPAAPVCHVSFFEADAYARWAGARLPTEFEWEAAAEMLDSSAGNFLEFPLAVSPRPAQGEGLLQMFGEAWQWTNSAFLGYPGFHPERGAIGEYNGKFMSGQFVLRGGSCATPRGHIRETYRNFFYPHQRWQFTGVRLAKDL